MSVYMLNLRFDWTSDVCAKYGRFFDYVPSIDPLAVSKTWLQSDQANPDPDDPALWSVSSRDNNKLSCKVGDQIWVRVAGAPAGSGRLTVLIARTDHGKQSDRAPQPSASPFLLGATTAPNTIWDTVGPDGKPFVPPSQAGSWVAQLGAVQLVDSTVGPNKFTLVVAATIIGTPSPGLMTLSHDPEMEVDG